LTELLAPPVSPITMNNNNSSFKKTVDISKPQRELERFEDPLVCSLCGNNRLTITDREEDEAYCCDCRSTRKLLDRSKIPEPGYVKTEKYWQKRFNRWKKGDNLTQQDLKELQETLYSTEHFGNDQKRRQILKYADTMEVTVNGR